MLSVGPASRRAAGFHGGVVGSQDKDAKDAGDGVKRTARKASVRGGAQEGSAPGKEEEIIEIPSSSEEVRGCNDQLEVFFPFWCSRWFPESCNFSAGREKALSPLRLTLRC